MVDLSHLASNPIVTWGLIILAAIVVLVIVRYFLHIVLHIIRFIMQFFWHGCGTVVFLILLYFVLHYFKLI